MLLDLPAGERSPGGMQEISINAIFADPNPLSSL